MRLSLRGLHRSRREHDQPRQITSATTWSTTQTPSRRDAGPRHPAAGLLLHAAVYASRMPPSRRDRLGPATSTARPSSYRGMLHWEHRQAGLNTAHALLQCLRRFAGGSGQAMPGEATAGENLSPLTLRPARHARPQLYGTDYPTPTAPRFGTCPGSKTGQAHVLR